MSKKTYRKLTINNASKLRKITAAERSVCGEKQNRDGRKKVVERTV